MTDTFTRQVEALYARYRERPDTRPSVPATEAEFLAAFVYVARDELSNDDVDFDRDPDGRIIGVRGIRLRDA